MLVGVVAAGVLVVNIHQGALFLALASVCIVMLYLAYLFVTVPLLLRRLTGWPKGASAVTTERGGKLFALGAWGVPVNLGAVVWGLLMMLNLAWPRVAVYNPSNGSWYLQWFAPLFVGGCVVVGAAVYLFYRSTIHATAAEPAPAAVVA